MPNLYESPTALAYLKGHIADNRGVHRYKTQLAEAAQCQLSYLSQVLAEKVLLNADHAAGLSDFWKLSDSESEFFLDLVALARASTPRLKQKLLHRLEKAKQVASRLSSKIPPAERHIAPGVSYYSAWYYTAVHILISIPGYQNENAIAERLGVSIPRVRQAIETLATLKLITRSSDKKWMLGTRSVHMDRESPLHPLHHTQWRLRAVDAIERQRDRVSYTGVHSISRADLDTLKEKLTDFLADARRLINPSPEEELVCLACDLFVV